MGKLMLHSLLVAVSAQLGQVLAISPPASAFSERRCHMKSIALFILASIAGLSWSSSSQATLWDSSVDYSTQNNPNGAWSYNRKWAVGGTAADLMTVQWDGSGWYLGNFGHGGPSFYAGPHLWAKNNTNGYPALRWTTPVDGQYDIVGSFIGDDARGIDNLVYVVMNGLTVFTGNVTGYLDEEPFAFRGLNLKAGDLVDFVLTWNGGVYSEYGWTLASVTISTEIAPAVQEPTTLPVMAISALVAFAFGAGRGRRLRG